MQFIPYILTVNKSRLTMDIILWYFVAMQNASNAFSDAVKEVYEPAWSERDKLVNLFDVGIANFFSSSFFRSPSFFLPVAFYRPPWPFPNMMH